MAANQTIIAGTTSQPVFVPARSIFTANPAAGATATVEYTTDSAAAVANRVAVFRSWPKGPVTSATSDMVNLPVYVRVTAAGGNVATTIEDSPSRAVIETYVRNWGGSNSAPYILAQSAVPVPVTGTLAETTLLAVTIPGGVMGPNGAIRIDYSVSFSANTNLKTVALKLGGTAISAFGRSTASETGCRSHVVLRNRGAANSQVISQPASTLAIFGVFTSTFPALAAINTAVDQQLIITGTLANAGDTITLEGYTVEVLPG